MRNGKQGHLWVVCSVLAGVLLLFASPAAAQGNNGGGVFGICAGWMPVLSPDCEVLGDDSPVGMALTTNGNPTAYIWANDNAQAWNVSLLVLAPGFPPPNYSVTFTQNGSSFTVGSTDGAPPPLPGVLSGTLTSGQRLLADVFGLSVFNGGTDYSFGNFQGVQTQPDVTEYSAFMFQSGLHIDTSNPDLLNEMLIQFSIGGDPLPPGTIILAVGQNEYGEWTFLTPLTTGMQVVPEPGTMVLLGTGLLALGLAKRRRMFR